MYNRCMGELLPPKEHEELLAADVARGLVSSDEFFDALGFTPRDRAIARRTVGGILENRIISQKAGYVLFESGLASGMVSVRRLSGIYEMTGHIMQAPQEPSEELIENMMLFAIYPVRTGAASASICLKLFPVNTPDQAIDPADAALKATVWKRIPNDQEFDLSDDRQVKLDVAETEDGVASIVHRMYRHWEMDDDGGVISSEFRPTSAYEYWKKFPPVISGNMIFRPYALSKLSTPEMVRGLITENPL